MKINNNSNDKLHFHAARGGYKAEHSLLWKSFNAKLTISFYIEHSSVPEIQIMERTIDRESALRTSISLSTVETGNRELRLFYFE